MLNSRASQRMCILALLSAILAGCVWIFCNHFWTSEFQAGPGGDGSYFTAMTYSILEPHRASVPLSTMHSRRVLGPLLVAFYLKVLGEDTTEPLHWGYNLEQFPRTLWSNQQKQIYDSIHRGWSYLDFASFVLLIFCLSLLLPIQFFPSIQGVMIVNFILTPSLGLLSIFQPQMNDFLGLALFALGLVLLKNKRDLPAMFTIGLAGLAREQTIMLLPIVYLFRKFDLRLAFLFVAGPYLLIALFPVFPDLVPWADNTTNVPSQSVSVFEAYKIIFFYNWDFFWSKRGLIQPLSILLNFGTCLIPIFASRLYKDFRFQIILGLTFLFMADRHMAPLNLVALFGLSQLNARLPLKSSAGVFCALLILATGKISLLVLAQGSLWLQLEHWFHFMDSSVYLYLSLLPFIIGLGFLLFFWHHRGRTEALLTNQAYRN